MNWSLSFGAREWDCVVVHPSVDRTEQTRTPKHDKMVRQLVAAQDLRLIDRKADDKSSPEEILSHWLESQLQPGAN